MYPFEFDMTTRAVFGEGVVAKVGALAAGFGKKALLLTYDEAFMKKIGFYQKVADSCKAAGIELISAFGVKSNPTLEHATGVITMAKAEKPDMIIALGGGSVMDEAKFVGLAALYDGDPWDFATGKAPIEKMLPVIAVVTIPATSSELNGTSVMSYEKIQRKDAIFNPLMRPKYAILDPELTYSIPIKQTAYSAADIISHLLDSYMGHGLEWAPFQDRYSQGSIRTVIECMDLKAAEAGIATLSTWFKKIGTPTTLAEAGIPNEAIVKMAPDALKTAQAWGLGHLYTVEKCTELFKLCR